MKQLLPVLLALLVLGADLASARAAELTPTRRLRRAYLALTMQEPDVERY